MIDKIFVLSFLLPRVSKLTFIFILLKNLNIKLSRIIYESMN